jgi:hypothetical protein
MNTMNDEIKTGTKVKGESKLQGLTAEQRGRLDGWLFEEQLGYEAVVELCRRELGVETNLSGVFRYYRQESQERLRRAKADNGGAAAWRLGISTDELYRELVTNTGHMALKATRKKSKPVGVNHLVQLMRLQISARREANQAQRVALAREKLEFDAATACLAHQTEIQAIAADNSLNEGEQIRAIREELFGTELPE